MSIVITCFDTDPEMLAAAVDSARAQTYAPVEILLVDDGSTAPATLDLLRHLDEDVSVIRQDNSGVAAARNHGMSRAAGQFLLPLDGDDILEPGYLAATVPVLRDDPGLAVVSTRAVYFGERTGPVDLPDPSLPWMVAENSIHNTSLFRRSDFDRLGGYDVDLRGFEDHEWWLRLLLDGGRARVLDDVLFRYRIRASSRNSSVSSSADCPARAAGGDHPQQRPARTAHSCRWPSRRSTWRCGACTRRRRACTTSSTISGRSCGSSTVVRGSRRVSSG